ncbi:transmembrane protein 101-like [Argonauta hians]
MLQTWRKRAMQVTLFILSRFPLVNGVTLLMLLGELAVYESYPPINPKVIYLHLGLFLVCGVLMSAQSGGKSIPLVYTGQLFYFAYNSYSNGNMDRDWLRTLICARHIGCAGVYIGVAYFLDKKSGRQLQQISHAVLGIYCLSLIVALNNNTELYQAFLYYFPLADVCHPLMCLLLGACAVSLFSGARQFRCRTFFTLALLISLVLLFIDCRVHYWNKYKKVHFWNQIRLISDHACITLGLILFGLAAY